MNEIDDIDEWFRLIDDFMNMGFSGAYMRRAEPVDECFQEDDDCIYFTIELRGVDEDELDVTTTEDTITLELFYEGRLRRKTYSLPHRINPKKSRITFNNGILDVTLYKVKVRKKKHE